MYRLIFHSGSYTAVDYEGSEEQCYNVKAELTAQMYASGERDFYYTIEEVK